MPVSKDLQDVIGRLGRDITAAKRYSRVDMGRLQRELRQIVEEAQAIESAAIRDRLAFVELVAGLDRQVLDRRALIQRARERHSGGNAPELQQLAG